MRLNKQLETKNEYQKIFRSRMERVKYFMDLTVVKPCHKVNLKDCKTGWAQNEEAKLMGKGELKDRANRLLQENQQQTS